MKRKGVDLALVLIFSCLVGWINDGTAASEWRYRRRRRVEWRTRGQREATTVQSFPFSSIALFTQPMPMKNPPTDTSEGPEKSSSTNNLFNYRQRIRTPETSAVHRFTGLGSIHWPVDERSAEDSSRSTVEPVGGHFGSRSPSSRDLLQSDHPLKPFDKSGETH